MRSINVIRTLKNGAVIGVVFLATLSRLEAEDILAAGIYYYDATITSFQTESVTIKHRAGVTVVAWKDLSAGAQMNHAAERKAALAKQAAEAAQPKPASTLPKEVMIMRSLRLFMKVSRYSASFYDIPPGAKVPVFASDGFHLEVAYNDGPHFRVPLEYTNFLSLDVPAQPDVSAEEKARIQPSPARRGARFAIKDST